MKKLAAVILILVTITGIAFAENLITAFGYDFGTDIETIRADMERYEGTYVSSKLMHSEDGKLVSNVWVRMPKDSTVAAFGRRIDDMIFIGSQENNGLNEVQVTLDGIEQVINYSNNEQTMIDAYNTSLNIWSPIIAEFAAAYGYSDDAATYCGESVSQAILTTTDELIDVENIKNIMPVEWFIQHKNCGIVIHCKNVMLELRLIQTEKKTDVFGPMRYINNDIIVTYKDSSYGHLAAVEPTPSPEPKQSLDGLNIMG